MKRKIKEIVNLAFLVAFLLASCMQAMAADLQSSRKITGVVVSATDGQPLIGASVLIKGSKQGTVTDVNGKFSLSVGDNASLLVTYVGFFTQEVGVGNQSSLKISLKESTKAIDEVVVVGYGVQKKKLVTGATVQVKGEDLEKRNTVSALQALQGQTSGVQITSTSGQPGEGMKVIVRGKGTINNPGPLYIVDGIQTGDISYLSNSDIASIDVLKDAASAAIYGSQSANGVVLITTRQGKSGRAQVTFDGYMGWQSVEHPISMLNSKEYATIMNEQAVNSGKSPLFTNDQINALSNGTDWIDHMLSSNVPTRNFTVGVSGGSEGSVYSTSLGTTSQAGIVGGKDYSNYERYNFRFNSEHNVIKNLLKVGQHMTFAYINKNGIQVGNQYSNSLRSAFNTNPFMPVYDENGKLFDNSNSTWNNGASNPYASMVYNNQNKNNNQKLLGDVYFELTPIKNMKFKSAFGIDYYANESRSFSPIYKLSIYDFNLRNKVTQTMEKGIAWNWDNLLSYNWNLNKDNHFDFMLGTSARKYATSWMQGKNADSVLDGIDYAYLDNTTNKDGVYMNLQGHPYEDQLYSVFGRVNYNYKETYMINTTFRADGSSKFAKGNRWGYFPSVSAGWTASNEAFMEDIKEWMDFLKIRASWGQNGNQSVDPFQYIAPIRTAYTNYTFGTTEGVLTPGAFPYRLSNNNLKWETAEQTDLGIDARFLNSKLSLTLDLYSKVTKDWIILAPVLNTAGAEPPYINGGNISNKGIELALGWRDHVGKFNYSVSGNIAYNKNKVTDVPTNDGIIHGSSNLLWNNAPEFYRAESGKPIGYFWGYKTKGVFQNEAQVKAYKYADGTLIQPNAKPGDLIYADIDGKNGITSADKTNIGDPNPDYTFGFDIACDYKGFDLSVTANGVAGNQLVQSYRNQADQFANYSKSMLNRWHGEGSSNRIPRLTEDAKNFTEFSDIYVQNGDFLRISNVALGYDFAKLLKTKAISQLRVYAAVQNLLTFTKYDGMDPEVGYGNDGGITDRFSSGIDLGYYPRPRTYMFGVNVKF